MIHPGDNRRRGCIDCASGTEFSLAISMAFQPIVDVEARTVFAQEALVRGPAGEPAGEVFRRVDHDNRYRFDQACRVTAIRLAASLNVDSLLSINFMPNAVYQPELCIRASLEAAERFGFPQDRLMFEFTEGERCTDVLHIKRIVQCYRDLGFKTAIDDFGAGYSGLNLLAELQTDYIKLDMALVRNIQDDRARQAIVRGVLQICADLGINAIAEGIETKKELHTLRELGVRLCQGYYFAKPAFEQLATINWGD